MNAAVTILGQSRERAELVALLSLSLLLAGVVLGLLGLLRSSLPRVLVGAVLGAGAAAWTVSNSPFEGATLYRVTPGNGVTVADLLLIPPAALLVLLLRQDRRR